MHLSPEQSLYKEFHNKGVPIPITHTQCINTLTLSSPSLLTSSSPFRNPRLRYRYRQHRPLSVKNGRRRYNGDPDSGCRRHRHRLLPLPVAARLQGQALAGVQRRQQQEERRRRIRRLPPR